MKVRLFDRGYNGSSTFRYLVEKRIFPFVWITIFYTDNLKDAQKFYDEITPSNIQEKKV